MALNISQTEIFTFFTQAGGKTQVLYSVQNEWKRFVLVLETAGPVSVGNQQILHPLTSGHGILLDQGTPLEWYVPPLQKLYIAADTTNRVKVIVSGIPWLAEILQQLGGTPSAPVSAVPVGGFGFKGTMPGHKPPGGKKT